MNFGDIKVKSTLGIIDINVSLNSFCFFCLFCIMYFCTNKVWKLESKSSITYQSQILLFKSESYPKMKTPCHFKPS